MAMIKCKECGSQVSNKAGKCPSCGVAMPKNMTLMQVFGAFILVAIMVSCVYQDGTNPTSTLKAATASASDLKVDDVHFTRDSGVVYVT